MYLEEMMRGVGSDWKHTHAPATSGGGLTPPPATCWSGRYVLGGVWARRRVGCYNMPLGIENCRIWFNSIRVAWRFNSVFLPSLHNITSVISEELGRGAPFEHTHISPVTYNFHILWGVLIQSPWPWVLCTVGSTSTYPNMSKFHNGTCTLSHRDIVKNRSNKFDS